RYKQFAARLSLLRATVASPFAIAKGRYSCRGRAEGRHVGERRYEPTSYCRLRRLRVRKLRPFGEHGLKRRIEDLDGKIDLVLVDRQWRCHPEAVRPRPGADDVHREAAPEALCGHGRPERVRRSAALPVIDELESDEQAAAADVADLLVRCLELAEPPEQVLPSLAGALDEAFLLDSLEHRETGGGGQRVGDVRGDVEEALP